MTDLAKGANTAVPTTAVRVEVSWRGGPDLDAAALLLTAAGKVRGDADFVFYNQPVSPGGAVRHEGKSGRRDVLSVDLPRLPPDVTTVAVTASADGAAFRAVDGLCATVTDTAGRLLARFAVPAAGAETAFVLGELYRRDAGWKFRAVGQGWASGLAGLATDYGISVEKEQRAPEQRAPQRHAPEPRPARTAAPSGPPPSMTKAVRLEKQLAGQPRQVVDLVKTVGVSLTKRGLDDHRARVALCLDISGSMHRLFRAGKVQQLCERILALAVQLDDDGQVDVFTFGGNAYQEAPINLANRAGYIESLQRHRQLEGGTDYAPAMRLLRRHYFPDGDGGPRQSPRSDRLPVYVMFVTDGATHDRDAAREQMRWSSYEPIFWQFMAIGPSSRNVDPYGAPPLAKAQKKPRGLLARIAASGFKFLEELDDMSGRLVDNADFFSVADPADIPDEQLYDLMMTEYPGWLKLAWQQGLLPTSA